MLHCANAFPQEFPSENGQGFKIMHMCRNPLFKSWICHCTYVLCCINGTWGREGTALTNTTPIMAISVEDSGQEENEEDAEENNAHDVDAGMYI